MCVSKGHECRVARTRRRRSFQGFGIGKSCTTNAHGYRRQRIKEKLNIKLKHGLTKAVAFARRLSAAPLEALIKLLKRLNIMESFHWDKHFITGLSEVDHQHHHLVDIINKFGGLIAEDKLIFDDMQEIFKELFEYARYHFQEEEAMMSRIGIDKRHLDSHIEAHQYYLQEVTSFHTAFSPKNLKATKNMLDFLTRWLAYHILGSDQNMARQIEAIKSGASSSEAYELEKQRISNATEPLLVALNSLFQQVTARNRDLAQLNKSLESKVEERTKALSEANLHLEELSLTDVLTALPNRRHGMRRLADIWDESSEAKTPLACIMVDADHFKEVNDTYGHDAGDAVLRELAKTLQQTVRSDDFLCRLGGDEFLIICPNTDRDGAMHFAELVRKAVSALQIQAGNGVWNGSVSAGVATRLPDMKNQVDLIKAADRSVYTAKRNGKNCVRAIS